jgi:hypothetical protein
MGGAAVKTLPDPSWQFLPPVERLEAIFLAFVGCNVPDEIQELAFLVGGDEDDPAWALKGAEWATNCGESLWGAIQHACLDRAGRLSVDPALARRSESGTSLTLVTQLMQRRSFTRRIGGAGEILTAEAPKATAMLWYASRPQRRNAQGAIIHDDHVALQLGAYAGKETRVVEGGGSHNLISTGKRDTLWSAGRQLVGFRLVETLSLPPARERPAPAFDGSAEALRNALDVANAASTEVLRQSIHERETLAPPEE